MIPFFQDVLMTTKYKRTTYASLQNKIILKNQSINQTNNQSINRTDPKWYSSKHSKQINKSINKKVYFFIFLMYVQYIYLSHPLSLSLYQSTSDNCLKLVPFAGVPKC